MVGEDDRTAAHAPAQGQAGRIEIRQVQADHIVRRYQARRRPADAGHDHGFADARRYRHAHHVHAAQTLAPGQRAVVL